MPPTLHRSQMLEMEVGTEPLYMKFLVELSRILAFWYCEMRDCVYLAYIFISRILVFWYSLCHSPLPPSAATAMLP